MGSLLDVARVRAAGKKRGGLCTIEALRRKHAAKAKEIDELIASSGPAGDVPYSVAAEILSETFDTRIKGDVVSRHNRRVCVCHS